MMLLRARDNNIQSFAYTWLHKGNQNVFLKHPKIKWLEVRTNFLSMRKLNGYPEDSNPQPLDCRSIALPLELI